ncbi:MAG: TonB-dependent receptor [Candidatus Polarisedimenticolia bacterium]
MSARRFSYTLAALLLLQGLTSSALLAQATTATVKGRVVDTDGGGLPGVVVIIKSKNQPTGNKQVVTDIEGNYRIPLLPPANDYTIRVDYPGFAPLEVGPLDLDPGKMVVQDMTLRSDAETTETIVVESQGNIVDTESTKTATSYNAEFIEGLPIIGHNYQDVLTLAPGVTDTDGDGNPNVHGARDTGLQYRLDGGNITDPVNGTFGSNLNSDMIEELEVITSGASAEYGRADGGFANIITKSGGNDFEGKLSLAWRGSFLNGDGANNNDVTNFESDFPDYHDFRPILSLSGAIVKDKLWYFGTIQSLDTELPVNQIGANILITSRGNYSFGKLTWQVNSYNKLAMQVTGDPRTFEGFGLQLGTSPDSDFTFAQGSLTPQLKWTSTISPQLLLESTLTSYNGRIQVDPVSKFFTPTTVELSVTDNDTVQARYPCRAVDNCNPARGEKQQYVIDLITGQTSGPFPTQLDQKATRNSIKTDLSYTIEDAWGQHSIKSGIEFQDEKFNDEPLTNPILIDVTEPFQNTLSGGSGDPSAVDAVRGFQILQTFEPLRTPQSANSFNSGIYIQDSWKPRPNLTVNVGLRVDREDIDSSGFEFFDPRPERRQSIDLWRQVCSELHNRGLAQATSNCYQIDANPGAFNGKPPTDFSSSPGAPTGWVTVIDPDSAIAYLDRVSTDQNLGNDGNWQVAEEADSLYLDFTSFSERQTENFQIINNNLAPRFSISWDPWADGKTKAFATWGRYYDRLFLSTVSQEIGPDRVNYLFQPDGTTHVINEQKFSQAASTTSVTQTDRNLSTPYTDEMTIGFERELAPEWSASVTYINKKGWDLLQDSDLNHMTCAQHSTIGIDPGVICGSGPGSTNLEEDRFGDTGTAFAGSTEGSEGGNFQFGGARKPNGAPDLYVVNNGFNQILRVSNSNSYTYEAIELKIVKRLHRNWQMQASYTLSEAFGQAEQFLSGLGNDPQTVDDEEGVLSFDQTHIVKFQAVTRLPKEVSIGSIVQWASGTPWSVVRNTIDTDDTGNNIFRTFYPSAQRNDERNTGYWTVDGRVEKNFTIGKIQASGYLSVENIFNADNLFLNEYDQTPRDGLGLEGFRDFGRRFEVGGTFKF